MDLRARPDAARSTTTTGPFGPGPLRGPRRQRAGLRTARHRQDPRALRPGPPSGGRRVLRPLHSGLPPGPEPAPAEAGELLPAKRDLDLPRRLRKLDNFDFLLPADLGYLPQGNEESEVLFTLIAERYERRSLGITSNLVFSEWEGIFANPMATAAAIDRVVHHSVILEFDVPQLPHQRRPTTWRSKGGEPAKLIDANRQECLARDRRLLSAWRDFRNHCGVVMPLTVGGRRAFDDRWRGYGGNAVAISNPKVFALMMGRTTHSDGEKGSGPGR